MELPLMEEVAREVEGAELFLYPGAGHLFADSSSVDHDEQAAALLMRRTLDLLGRVS